MAAFSAKVRLFSETSWNIFGRQQRPRMAKLEHSYACYDGRRSSGPLVIVTEKLPKYLENTSFRGMLQKSTFPEIGSSLLPESPIWAWVENQLSNLSWSASFVLNRNNNNTLLPSFDEISCIRGRGSETWQTSRYFVLRDMNNLNNAFVCTAIFFLNWSESLNNNHNLFNTQKLASMDIAKNERTWQNRSGRNLFRQGISYPGYLEIVNSISTPHWTNSNPGAYP